MSWNISITGHRDNSPEERAFVAQAAIDFARYAASKGYAPLYMSVSGADRGGDELLAEALPRAVVTESVPMPYVVTPDGNVAAGGAAPLPVSIVEDVIADGLGDALLLDDLPGDALDSVDDETDDEILLDDTPIDDDETEPLLEAVIAAQAEADAKEAAAALSALGGGSAEPVIDFTPPQEELVSPGTGVVSEGIAVAPGETGVLEEPQSDAPIIIGGRAAPETVAAPEPAQPALAETPSESSAENA